MVTILRVVFCPRCNRKYEDLTFLLALENVKKHVTEQHPDYDPFWYETYPENRNN